MGESVAWIAELKNTLSLPPLLLAMCAYIDYEEHGKRRDYFLALGLFLIAMLCKASMVMFPFIILLYAWWKRGRVNLGDLKSSTPFFVVSIGIGLAALWSLQRAMHAYGLEMGDIPGSGFFSRVAFAGSVISFYFSKSLLPVELETVYPQWAVDPLSPTPYLPWLILGGAGYVCWRKRTGWGRHVLLGLGFFLITLAPFVGFNQAPYMGFSWVMDHILYIPIIGWIGLVAAGMEQIIERGAVSVRACLVGMVALLFSLLAWESRGYASLYRNSEVLWIYTLQHNPDAWPGHNNLGLVLLDKGRPSEAMEQFEQTISLCPTYAKGHNNMGLTGEDREVRRSGGTISRSRSA